MLSILTCAPRGRDRPRGRNPRSRPRRDHTQEAAPGFPAGAGTAARLLTPASRRHQAERQEEHEKRKRDPPSPGSIVLRLPPRSPGESRRQRRGTVPPAGGRQPPPPRPRRPLPSLSSPLPSPHGSPRGPPSLRLSEAWGWQGESWGRSRPEEEAAKGGGEGGCCRSGRGLLQPQLCQLLPARPPSEGSLVPGTTSAVAGGLPATEPGPAAARLPPPPGPRRCRRRLRGARDFQPEKSCRLRLPLKTRFVFLGACWSRVEAPCDLGPLEHGQPQALERGLRRAASGSCREPALIVGVKRALVRSPERQRPGELQSALIYYFISSSYDPF